MQTSSGSDGRTPWLDLVAVLALAWALRLWLYTGFFGSDEVTYTARAAGWLLGDRGIPEYVGANRLGITWPVAGLMAVLGRNEFSANLWSLICSLGEIGLVWAVGLRLGGRSLAVAASLLLALTPLHIHLAGRMMADAPVALFVTLSAAALLLSSREGATGAFFSGLAVGLVYWVKPPVAICAIVPLLLLVVDRRPLVHFVVWGAALLAVVGLHFATMAYYTGDALFMLRVLRKGMGLLDTVSGLDERAHAYLVWWLADMRFTWLLGWFSLVGAIVALGSKDQRSVALRITLWWCGLLALFSLWPASFQPLRLIFKQPNYMALFLAPAALAGALLLVRLSSSVRAGALVVYTAGSIGLGALLQADIQTFSANARATAALAARQNEGTYYLGVTGRMAVELDAALRAPDLERLAIPHVKSLADAGTAKAAPAIAVLDPIAGPHRGDPTQIAAWPNASCWDAVGSLPPQPLAAPARMAVLAVREVLSALPHDGLNAKAAHFMATPPAQVYRLKPGCRAGPSE